MASAVAMIFLSHLSGDEDGEGGAPDNIGFLSHLSGDEE